MQPLPGEQSLYLLQSLIQTLLSVNNPSFVPEVNITSAHGRVADLVHAGMRTITRCAIGRHTSPITVTGISSREALSAGLAGGSRTADWYTTKRIPHVSITVGTREIGTVPDIAPPSRESLIHTTLAARGVTGRRSPSYRATGGGSGGASITGPTPLGHMVGIPEVYHERGFVGGGHRHLT